MRPDRALAVLPVPREEFVELALRRPGDAVEDVGEPGLRIDIVELGGADEGVHRRRPHAAAVGAGEQPRLPAQSDTAQCPFGSVVRKADAAVVEEAGEEVPAPEHVIHRLGHGGMARQLPALGLHPALEIGQHRRAQLLAYGEALLGGLAVDPRARCRTARRSASPPPARAVRSAARSCRVPCWPQCRRARRTSSGNATSTLPR